jgi:hypothetical protein
MSEKSLLDRELSSVNARLGKDFYPNIGSILGGVNEKDKKAESRSCIQEEIIEEEVNSNIDKSSSSISGDKPSQETVVDLLKKEEEIQEEKQVEKVDQKEKQIEEVQEKGVQEDKESSTVCCSIIAGLSGVCEAIATAIQNLI